MAGLNASDGLAGFEYAPNARSLRLSWPRPFPTEPNQARTSQHPTQLRNQQHDHNQQSTSNGARLSVSPRPGPGGVYEQALSPHHGLSSTLPTSTQPYSGPSMTSFEEYRPRSHGNYQTFGQSMGNHLQDPTQDLGLYQHQDSFQHQAHASLADVHAGWPLDQPSQPPEQFSMSSPFTQEFYPDAFNLHFQTSAEDFAQPPPAQYDTALPDTYSGQVDNILNLHEFSNELGYTNPQSFADINGQLHPNSPTNSTLDTRSLSSSDNGWVMMEFQNSFPDAASRAISNPEVALHGRTFSDSSYSDVDQQRVQMSWDHISDVPQHPIGSPDSDSAGEVYLRTGRCSNQQSSPSIKQESKPTSPVLHKLNTKPIPIKPSTSPQRSPISPTRNSPTGRKQQPRKNSNKSSKPTIGKKLPSPKNEAEKKIGRRKGPLRPEQRKQASEIRKLGACLRCRFLKKTCDAGEPCHGCCPSHQRQWQVPCTRMDIKDLAFFMADWNTHFHQHVGVGFTIANIAGHGSGEQTLYVTHGYGGHLLPIRAREVLVRENDCFGLDWVEEFQNINIEHSVQTASLSSGKDGISTTVLSQYIDKHIDIGFEQFVDEFFEGTPFLTEMLKTAHRFWTREKTPVVRKALKMLLAYNLIYHITLVEGIPSEENFPGKIEDEDSRFCGKTMAPGMINFEVKVAMAAMWRELQKEVLEDLSQLYRGVYSKDKLMNWPIIFMVITILLAVWEELQFDYNYRYPERTLVDSFCNEMEGIPVKVIIGLFSAMSQRFPAFQEWDTRKHHHAFNSNGAVCDALTEVRQHVTRHDQYLRNRQKTAFDRSDFDSLSSKFTSQLVIRSVA